MISKRGRGRLKGTSQFPDLARYIAGSGKSERVRFHNCGLVLGENLVVDLSMAIIEVNATQNLNTRAQSDKTYHLIVSFQNGEKPSDAVLDDIEQHMAARMGLSEHQRISALHTDTDNWHLHVAINLIHPDTHNIASIRHDYAIRDIACAELEERHGLKVDQHRYYLDEAGRIRKNRDALPGRKGQRAGQIENNRGVESFESWLKRTLVVPMKAAQNRAGAGWQTLHAALAEMNLEIVPQGNGLAVRDRDTHKHAAKASALGRGFSKPALEKRFGPYEPPAEAAKNIKARETYTEQPIRAVNHERREKQVVLYNAWRAERGQRDQAKVEAWKAQRASEKKRRQAISDHAKKRRERVKAGTGTAAEKRAAYKTITMDRLLDQENLSEAFKHERAALRDEYGKAETYRDYLQREAQQGNETALAGLRDVSKAQERPEQAKADAFRPGQGYANEAQPAKLAREFKGQAVAYQVHKNGDVSYRLAGRDALRDTGRRIEVHQGTDRATVELGLRLARARFGQTVNASGSEVFKRMAVEIAVEQRMDVKFSDPALEAYRRQLEKDRDAAKRLPSPAERLAKVDTERRAKPAAPRQAAKREAAPTPADRLKDKSRTEAEAWAKDAGYTVVPANKTQGRYSGEILWQSETHCVQAIGRNEAVIHSRGDLEKAYKRGQAATIQYQDGKGREIDGPEHAPGRGRGLPGPGRKRDNDRER